MLRWVRVVTLAIAFSIFSVRVFNYGLFYIRERWEPRHTVISCMMATILLSLMSIFLAYLNCIQVGRCWLRIDRLVMIPATPGRSPSANTKLFNIWRWVLFCFFLEISNERVLAIRVTLATSIDISLDWILGLLFECRLPFRKAQSSWTSLCLPLLECRILFFLLLRGQRLLRIDADLHDIWVRRWPSRLHSRFPF